MPNKNKEQESPILKLILQIGGVAAAISAIIGLIFLLLPNLKPEPPQKMEALISNLAVEQNVMLKDYLKRQQLESTQYTNEQLQVIGVVVSFNVKIEGFKGRSCLLKWSVYNNESVSRVPENWLVDRDFRTFTPEAEVDQAGSDIWIPLTGREELLFARLELYDDKGVRIAFADSPTFPGIP